MPRVAPQCPWPELPNYEGRLLVLLDFDLAGREYRRGMHVSRSDPALVPLIRDYSHWFCEIRAFPLESADADG